jgi:nuclear GTP-binding protein
VSSSFEGQQLICQTTHIVETEPFANTFGPKAQRKRPRISVGGFAELAESSQAASEAKEGGK